MAVDLEVKSVIKSFALIAGAKEEHVCCEILANFYYYAGAGKSNAHTAHECGAVISL